MANIKTINQFWEIVRGTDRPKRDRPIQPTQPSQRPAVDRPKPVVTVLPTRVRLRRSGLTMVRYQIIQAGSVGRVVTCGAGWLVVNFNGALVKIASNDDRLEVLP